MNEPIKRRNLFSVQPASEALPVEAIAAIAARNGFPEVEPQIASPMKAPDQQSARRQRQPKGRDHQFNVRLRRDTLDFIYAQANERNIPVAQVVEEATEALKRKLVGS